MKPWHIWPRARRGIVSYRIEERPMKHYLAKTEPTVYSIDDLERDNKTVWDGVTNPQAVKAIRAMQPGDRVFLYHSGGVSAVVGIATVLSAGRDDAGNPKSAVVDLAYGGGVGSPPPPAGNKQAGFFRDLDRERT